MTVPDANKLISLNSDQKEVFKMSSSLKEMSSKATKQIYSDEKSQKKLEKFIRTIQIQYSDEVTYVPKPRDVCINQSARKRKCYSAKKQASDHLMREEINVEYLRLPTLTIDEAKTSFIESINGGFAAAFGRSWQQLHISNIKPSSVWNNQLLSITETRSTSAVEHYLNAQPFGAEVPNKSPSSLWDIEVDVPKDLESSLKKSTTIPLLYTLKTEECFCCRGKGHVVCSNCNGNGQTICDQCFGSCHTTLHELEEMSDSEGINPGFTVDTTLEVCDNCDGRGQLTCCECDGELSKSCCRCNGHGQMKKYTELKVKWSTLCDDYFSHDCKLSSEFLRYCVGDVVYETKDCDAEDEVLTLQDCLNMEMIKASAQLIHEHRLNAKKERSKIRKQKQVVSVIPLYEVEAEWKGRRIIYWIAGINKKVYVPNRFL